MKCKRLTQDAPSDVNYDSDLYQFWPKSSTDWRNQEVLAWLPDILANDNCDKLTVKLDTEAEECAVDAFVQ